MHLILVDDDVLKGGLQVFIHITSMIDDKLTCRSKISFENMTRIKSFQICLKNNYENDVSL